ncbi:UV-damage endonuclease [Beauveria bassiana]|uniref:UV-damage endonuclease n=1 Tax=Beauveria bassiana TaxID=176275 RepID=A0A2N6N975_BEABA|nr:UV-damage endonuclease [Beauveria bassiana]
MAPKRKTAVVEMVAVDVEAATLSRRKLPRRSTQQVKEESIAPLPEMKSEVKIVEKRTRTRTTSKPQARPQAKTQTPDVKVEDDEAENDDEAVAVERGARRAPPVNSDILPLPWSGRLGYPEHPTKNRPDKSKPADVSRGLAFVQDLGLANARDIAKMLRWNDKYGIKFLRLSSEMFPFASHAEYGYKLAPFAADALGEAGRVAAELGHRLTTHPGQFTQLGSPRKEVVDASFRDLEYHDELLSLLKLPPQLDRDAVMILHMGGIFGDKQATLVRFRENYKKLPQGVQNRLVLENDDVGWSVHDLLPVCEELNIPLVLDYHHHNIIFDDASLREGTRDIIDLYPRITATWTRKSIKQKMHYSEPTAAAVTPRERRKHSARVKVLPPCACDMDLMIEAKDKEQAVFELMRTYKLPGWDLANDVVPYERDDDEPRAAKKAAARKAKREMNGDGGDVEEEVVVSAEDFGMGGPENRVYWPEGMEEWLKPMKKGSKKEAKAEEKSNVEEDESN